MKFKKNRKYTLIADYVCPSSINGFATVLPYIVLGRGLLHIKEGYSWDGPSGPTWDTTNFMRGSLEHDALYQLIREGQLPRSVRRVADLRLFNVCREDGMSLFRAGYVYLAVRVFG